MIYNFDKDDTSHAAFVSVLKEQGLDYEEIRRDRIVVRVFGEIDEPLRLRLDRVSGRSGKLTLKRRNEHAEALALRRPRDKFFIAGPCSVESEGQIDRIAAFLSHLGVKFLRGGAFKPRTSPESFQGIGRTGLKIMAAAAARHGLKVVTELMDQSQLDDVLPYADIIQVGSRNMFNYPLLTTLGAVDKPILLKRGMAATIDEWAAAADYILKGGNERVILCERGIRTFEPRTRFTLDILAIPLARQLTGLPVVADVSHAAGERSLVPPLMRAALAAGADGIMVEVHPEPEAALSDGVQSLSFAEFETVFRELHEAKLL
jgi:3-deoxy-7-phosphoheptulonate synthase